MPRGSGSIGLLAGPLSYVAVVATWATLLALGWAFVFLPQLPQGFHFDPGLDPAQHSGFLDALYVSLVNLTSLGYGDISPESTLLRMLGPVETMFGLGLLTASISWLISIYNSISRRDSLAHEVHLAREAEERLGEKLVDADPELLESLLAGFAEQIIRARRDLIHFPITHYFRTEDEERALAGLLPFLSSLVEEAGAEEQPHSLRVRAEILRMAIADFAETCKRGCGCPARAPRRSSATTRTNTAQSGGEIAPRPAALYRGCGFFGDQRGCNAMRNLWVLVSWVAFALAMCVALAGCGSDEGSDEDRVLRGTFVSFPDYLDPGLSFTLEGGTALHASYIPLLTYAPKSGKAGTELIPGLATDLPKIDQGGRRYTLFLRPGLEYSDGTPVRASDFAFAIERLFRVNSGGSTFYTDIVGAERFAKTKQGGISGISSDDASGKIVIRLTEPSGYFSYILGLPFSAPLPPSTPIEDQTANPPPATGPYMITAVRPGRSWEYERNPAWEANGEAMPQFPDGHVDKIKLEVRSNPVAQTEEVEKGEVDWMKNPPPPELYADVKDRYEGTQFREEEMISVYYFWMNTQTPPFDDVRVRRAVNYAVDPEALERIFADTLEKTQQVLPPLMPGYRQFELYPHNLVKAKKLITEADPADRKITVWTFNLAPSDEAGEYYEQVLRQLGFETTLKIVDFANYFTLIGNSSTPDLDTGFANWLLDYPHPNDYFAPQLTGESILPNGNSNWALFDDPAVNAKTRELGRQPLGPKQEREYAALDRTVMQQAPWAPFGTLTLGAFVADTIDLDKLVVSPIYGQDLTSFEFK
jgi:peptide/nickel transport system substrate-binding protein